MKMFQVRVNLLIEAESEDDAYELVTRSMKSIQDVEFEERLLAWNVDDIDFVDKNEDYNEDE